LNGLMTFKGDDIKILQILSQHGSFQLKDLKQAPNFNITIILRWIVEGHEVILFIWVLKNGWLFNVTPQSKNNCSPSFLFYTGKKHFSLFQKFTSQLDNKDNKNKKFKKN